MMGRGQPMDVNEWVIRPLLSNASVIALFLIPMITMRLYAEEKRSGTMELLLTSPVRDIEIILGKFLASLVMFACVIGVSAVDLAALFAYGKPDWKPILVGYLGLLLQGGALIAIGIGRAMLVGGHAEAQQGRGQVARVARVERELPCLPRSDPILVLLVAHSQETGRSGCVFGIVGRHRLPPGGVGGDFVTLPGTHQPELAA